MSKRLAELDKAISILRPLKTTIPTETVHRKPAAEDNSPVQDDNDVDNEEVSPSTSRKGSRRSNSNAEDTESSSSKRKRSSGSSSGGDHQHESLESDTVDNGDDNSRTRRIKRASNSSRGMGGSPRLLRTSSKDQKEEAMASLLVLIDENTAIVDMDMHSLDSTETASTAS